MDVKPGVGGGFPSGCWGKNVLVPEDKLEDLFRMQRRLQEIVKERTGDSWLDGDDAHAVRSVKENILALQSELQEALNELPWKPWKKSAPPSDWDKFREELVDAFHFIVNLSLIANMSAEELWHRYRVKHEINVQRQLTGY